MKLQVIRTEFTSFSTVGELYVGVYRECYTLEPVWDESASIKPRAIPEGTYKLTKRFSPKHGRDVPHVENVPGFQEIEIHPGNFPKDTEGCTLVGRTKGPHPDFIGGSQLAFDALWKKLCQAWDRGEEIWITYVNNKEKS